MRVATDVGGTFTDLVCYERLADGSHRVRAVKTDTVYPAFEQGVLNAIDRSGIAASEIEFFAHGSTIVINSLLARRGVPTGLITTRGFRDVLEIARGNRPDLFNFLFKKPPPFVPRHLRLEVTERLDNHGQVVAPLQLADVAAALEIFRREGVQAIAVCFLHAYANPAHERAVVEEIKRLWPEVAVVASHEISREWREYERTSTTVLTAYILPVAARYLDRLDARLREAGLRVPPYMMQSNGGIATVESAKRNPISLVESGPASGMLGAVALGHAIGDLNLLALDIGGTTAKCALIDAGTVKITTEYRIEYSRKHPGYPIKTPVIDLVEIGNGGGSIAWVDEGGKLHVGPQSAGSTPGPAAYGRGGTEPTTTDANLMTGRINPALFAGGDIRPDMAAVEQALSKVARQLRTDVPSVARGILRIANDNMTNALKLVSVNRGYDPRDFALVAFGGGGAMHGATLAQELGVRKLIIPVNGAVFSAWGMLVTDLRRDHLRTQLLPLADSNLPALQDLFAELQAEALAEYARDQVASDRVVCEQQAEVRYKGQEHTVSIGWPDAELTVSEIARRFANAHQKAYGFALDSPIEVVTLHVVAWGRIDKPLLPALAVTGRTLDAARKGTRRVDFDAQGVHEAAIFDRDLLEPGMEFAGPAIVEEPSTVTVILPGQQAQVDPFGNLHIALHQPAASAPSQQTLK
jgi:N-methylhydantoinase A